MAKAETPAQKAKKKKLNENTLVELRGRFQSWGLPGSLSSWAWDQIVKGKSNNEILLDLYERPEFKARFPGIHRAREAGIVPLSVESYLGYESAVAEAARRYGLPESFWRVGTFYSERLARWMENGLSARQVQERLDEGFAKVDSAPAEVREGFFRLFGVQEKAALATAFLDEERSMQELAVMRQAAEVAGTAGRFGIGMDVEDAQRLGRYDFGLERLRQGFGEISTLGQLFEENVGEAEDLTAQETGVEAAFNLSGEGAAALRKRAEARTAGTSGDTGTATSAERGAYGLGTAR